MAIACSARGPLTVDVQEAGRGGRPDTKPSLLLCVAGTPPATMPAFRAEGVHPVGLALYRRSGRGGCCCRPMVHPVPLSPLRAVYGNIPRPLRLSPQSTVIPEIISGDHVPCA